MTQLGTGLLGYRSSDVALPGIIISIEYLEKPIRSLQMLHQNSFFASFLLRSPRPALWKGQEVFPGTALVFGDLEHDLVLPEHSLMLNIQICALTAGSTGLLALEPGLWHCNPSALSRFVAACETVVSNYMRPDGRPGADAPLDGADEMTLIARFLASLNRPQNILPSAQYHIMQQVETLVAQQGWSERFGIDNLASAIGVPRRTMHRSFKDIYGIGPQGFLRLMRLHHFRKTLLCGDAISVTDAALSAGFEHFGRAARYYRQQFGELPKQTFSRAALP